MPTDALYILLRIKLTFTLKSTLKHVNFNVNFNVILSKYIVHPLVKIKEDFVNLYVFKLFKSH
jgi:hypothetical protein